MSAEKSLGAVQTRLDQFSRESKVSSANIDALKLSIKDHQRKLTACKHAAIVNPNRAESSNTSQRQISGHILQDASCRSVMASNVTESSTLLVQDGGCLDSLNTQSTSLSAISSSDQATRGSSQLAQTARADHHSISRASNQLTSITTATSSSSQQGSIACASSASQSIPEAAAALQHQQGISAYSSVSPGNSLVATSSNALISQMSSPVTATSFQSQQGSIVCASASSQSSSAAAHFQHQLGFLAIFK